MEKSIGSAQLVQMVPYHLKWENSDHLLLVQIIQNVSILENYLKMTVMN